MNRLKITNVKLNGVVIWRDPEIVLNEWFDNMDKKLVDSEYKEAKEVIARIMEKK